jgi:hypothetical protein
MTTQKRIASWNFKICILNVLFFFVVLGIKHRTSEILVESVLRTHKVHSVGLTVTGRFGTMLTLSLLHRKIRQIIMTLLLGVRIFGIKEKITNTKSRKLNNNCTLQLEM